MSFLRKSAVAETAKRLLSVSKNGCRNVTPYCRLRLLMLSGWNASSTIDESLRLTWTSSVVFHGVIGN